MKPVSTLVNIFLSLVALMHLVRLIFRIEVTWGGTVIPLWTSLFGCLVTAGLSILLWREGRSCR